MLLKISLTVNMTEFYTNRARGSSSNELLGRGRRKSPDLNRFPAIPVELKGEFIYDVASCCDNARQGTPILQSELK